MGSHTKHEEIIICACHSTDHQIIFLYDDDPDWEDVYVHIYLSQSRNFFERLWYGLKYIFGYKSKYGEFDEIILKPQDYIKLQNVVDKLKKEHDKNQF